VCKTSLKLFTLLLVSIMVISLTACSLQIPTSETKGSDESSKKVDSTTTENNAGEETAPTENIVLKLYTNYTDAGAKAQMDYAMAEMKKLMPNVSLEIDPAAQDSDVKLKTMMATGNLPDIIGCSAAIIPTAVKANNIIPLEDYIEKLNIADQITPAGLALLKQQEDEYGHIWVMFTANPVYAVIYANKALFEQAGAKIPENYDEFMTSGKMILNSGITPLGIWLKETWPPLQLFDMLSIAAENPKGITDLDEGGKGKASDPAFVDAAQKILEVANAGFISKDAVTMDYDAAVAQFKNEKSAMFVCGSWLGKEIGDALGDKVTILLPSVLADASLVQSVKDTGVISGGDASGGFAVASNSKYKDIAAEYAIQLGLKNVEGRIVKLGEQNALLKSAPASEEANNALQEQLADAIYNAQSATTMGWSFKNSKIQTDLGSEILKLFTGQYKVEDFTKNVDAAIEKNRNQ